MDDTPPSAGGDISARVEAPDSSVRWAGRVRLVSVVAIILGLLLIGAALPMETAIRAVTGWVEGLGPVGPLVYAGIYLCVTLLMLPAAAISLVAGALFGLLWGSVAVWLGANVGAALAFLIARYLARDVVERKLASFPKFRAIDRAVANGGWKIVALLRLSPAVPFNLQNYLYGLTGISFWSCVGATAFAMLPGIVLYVYLGHAGRASIEAAAAGEVPAGPGTTTLFIVGLLATLALTIYITHAARRAIAEQTGLEEAELTESDAAEPADGSANHHPWRSAGILAGLAVLLLATAACAQLRPQWLTQWFGPPQVTMSEAHEEKPEGPTFDHSQYAAVLEAHVNENGGVDYAGLADNPDQLLAYNEALSEAPWEKLGRDEKLALLLNAYNSFTLQLMIEWLEKPEVDGIRDIPAEQRWKAQRWNIAGRTWSLDQIEHEQIRQHFVEPDYHFAAVCAAVGCPPLRAEPYTGDKLDQQLRDQARRVHTDGTRWFQYDPEQKILHLTPIYRWYRGDFEQVSEDILTHAATYNQKLAADLEAGDRPTVRWLDYDWSLNDQEALPYSSTSYVRR